MTTGRGRCASNARGRWRAIDPRSAPPVPGLYALFSGDQLVYVGSAINLRDRLTDHGLRRRQLRGPGRFSQLPQLRVKIAGSRRPGDWLAREYRLIRRLRPQLNALHSGPGRRRDRLSRVPHEVPADLRGPAGTLRA